jgi:alpha-galactosidase
MFKTILFIILSLTITNILNAQLHTAKPVLGWNSWHSYGKFPTEKTMLVNIQAMAQKLKPFGYNYFVIDGGWNAEKDSSHNIVGYRIDKWGRDIPAKSAFPNGLKPVADAAHKAGLKFGIHILRGIPRIAYYNNLPVYNTTYRAQDFTDTNSICRWNNENYGIDMSRQGGQAYYDSYISLLVSWGVDFIKADDMTSHPDEIKAVRLAIRKTGKAILLSLVPGGDSKPEYMYSYKPATMLRIARDMWDNQKSINHVFEAWQEWSEVSFDSLWQDMGNVPFGHLCLNNSDSNYLHAAPHEGDKASQGKERMSSFSKDQQYTVITQWALSASPLFMGGDLPTSDSFSFSLITNKYMLACDQNGVIGELAYAKDSIEVWKTPNKNNDSKGWIGIFNRSTKSQNFSGNLSDFKLKIMYPVRHLEQ